MDDVMSALLSNHHSFTGYPVDRLMIGMLLREARRTDQHAEVQAAIMQSRKASLRWMTLTQRHWQTSVSRRPQCGPHHDSWAAREKYVRISNSEYR
jgi:hypothetical protein